MTLHTGSVRHGGYRHVPASPTAEPTPAVAPLLAELRKALDDRYRPIDHGKVQRLERQIDEAFGM